MVKRINKSKDYYEILGLKRDCSDADIKKQYKKLALQLHPDKNGAPGAEDAFKKVSQAFSCLSEPSKRQLYDVRGSDEPAGPRVRHSYDGDLSPEEIFAAFFGGGFEPSVRQRRPTSFRTYTYTAGRGWDAGNRNRNQENRHEHRDNTGFNWSCLQLLPLLLIFFLGFFSRPSEPLFQLHRTGKFTLEQNTKNGVPYFVKADFFKMYDTSNGGLTQLEQLVEETWVQEMRQECYQESQNRDRIGRQAKYYSGTSYGKTLEKQFEDFKKPACDALKKAGVSTGNWY